MLPPLSPLDAYRADRARARPHWAADRVTFDPMYGLVDGVWLVIASFLERVATAPWDLRPELLRNHERALAGVLGPVPVPLPPGHPFAWVAALRGALTPTPERADPEAVTSVVRGLAAEMAAAGALHLAGGVLWAVGCALPAVSPATRGAVLCERAWLVEQLGDLGTARALYGRALQDAHDAGDANLARDAADGLTRTAVPAGVASSEAHPEGYRADGSARGEGTGEAGGYAAPAGPRLLS